MTKKYFKNKITHKFNYKRNPQTKTNKIVSVKFNNNNKHRNLNS